MSPSRPNVIAAGGGGGAEALQLQLQLHGLGLVEAWQPDGPLAGGGDSVLAAAASFSFAQSFLSTPKLDFVPKTSQIGARNSPIAHIGLIVQFSEESPPELRFPPSSHFSVAVTKN
jgi:hypothetical protein